MRIIFTVIFCIALGLSSVVLPQDSTGHSKAFTTVSIGEIFLTDSSFGATGFDIASDAHLVQVALYFPLTDNIWLGPTITQSFGNSDSLKHSSYGVIFAFNFAPNFDFIFNPAYAVKMHNFESWLNATIALRRWFASGKWFVQAGASSIDGNLALRSDIGVRIK